VRDGWYYEEARASPDGSGRTIACLLMPRLARTAAQAGAPAVVVAQYGRSYWAAGDAYRAKADADVAHVLGCARQAGLLTIDLAAPLKAAIAARGLDPLYGRDHHTPAGNRLVAELLQQELRRHNLLPVINAHQSE
jgi:hypothetical protein